MTWKQGESREWELPHLREAHQVPLSREKGANSGSGDFWSVEFYPYTQPGVDPVFAVIADKHILICRTPETGKENSTMQVIQAIVDDEPNAENYACTWSKDLKTGTPLLCVSGATAKIRVINALTGEVQRTLIGHGGEINDLSTSPINHQIIASASEDSTVRIWSLDPNHARQPCAAILAGDGHREGILTIAFHATGRYLLSGGMDRVINLWTLPEFPDKNTGTDNPTLIHYPHFSSSEVHSGIIDCIAFHNSLILSKANDEQCIVLWSINGFSSSSTPPDPSLAPTTHDAQCDTRSAFSPATTTTNHYTRLLQFAVPDCNTMFMRFSLFSGSVTSNPVLAVVNVAAKIFFWDFKRLEEYFEYIAALSFEDTNAQTSKAAAIEPKRPSFLVPFRHRTRGGKAAASTRDKDTLSRIMREASPTDSTGADSHLTGSGSSDVVDPSAAENTGPKEKALSKEEKEKSHQIWRKKYAIGDPMEGLGAHKEEVVKGLSFTGRQVGWSMDGEWCVAVGSNNVIAVWQRWGK